MINDLKGNSETAADNKPLSDKQDETSAKVDEVRESVDNLGEKLSEEIKSLGNANAAAKEKQAIKSDGSMSASGNVGNNQQFIQNAVFYAANSLEGFNLREVRTEAKGTTDGKEYDLSKPEQFADFGMDFAASEQFAVAVVMCVFDYIELDDLQNLKSKFMEQLPKLVDGEGKEIPIKQNPYLSINGLLKTVNGKMFTKDDGENCIGLGDNRPAALRNLWEQFTSMRESVSRWLLTVSDIFEYRTNFDAFQVTSAFANLLKLDFSAGVRHLFPRLLSNPDKCWLFGLIALDLYGDKNYRARILPYLNDWAASNGSWLWRVACFVYANIKPEDEDADFIRQADRALARRFQRLTYDDLHYIGLLLIVSERLRTSVLRILNYRLEKARKYDEKIALALVYTHLVRFGYYAVSRDSPDCPLVACDNKVQLESVQPLISSALQRYDTRHLLFVLLEAYLKEISRYSLSDKTKKHITAYFVAMAANNERHAGDILMFLRNSKCSLADELISVIQSKFQNITIGGKING
jgi:hypothetical protein